MAILIIVGVGILGAGLLLRQLVRSTRNSACTACGQPSACSFCEQACNGQGHIDKSH